MSVIGFAHLLSNDTPRTTQNALSICSDRVSYLRSTLQSSECECRFEFYSRHFYSTSSVGGFRDIYECSETGTVLSSIIPPSLVQGDELRGIASGRMNFFTP